MHHKGELVHLSQQACWPAAAFFDEKPDLVVDTQYWRLIYYSRENITWE